MNKSESIVELSKALNKFQKEVKQPFKDADNPFFKSKYVPLESVVQAINDIAPNHGLSFTQWALNDENGRIGVATLLLHESGEFIEYDPVFMTAEKNTPQGAGSLITYLKRYTLSAIFGITSDQDDDGNESSEPPKATDKQLNLITKMINNDKDRLNKMLQYYKVKDLTKLTTNQASQAIKQLQAQS